MPKKPVKKIFVRVGRGRVLTPFRSRAAAQREVNLVKRSGDSARIVERSTKGLKKNPFGFYTIVRKKKK